MGQRIKARVKRVQWHHHGACPATISDAEMKKLIPESLRGPEYKFLLSSVLHMHFQNMRKLYFM